MSEYYRHIWKDAPKTPGHLTGLQICTRCKALKKKGGLGRGAKVIEFHQPGDGANWRKHSPNCHKKPVPPTPPKK